MKISNDWNINSDKILEVMSHLTHITTTTYVHNPHTQYSNSVKAKQNIQYPWTLTSRHTNHFISNIFSYHDFEFRPMSLLTDYTFNFSTETRQYRGELAYKISRS